MTGSPRLASLLPRALLAALLLFASEIVLWPHPAARPLSDWPALIAGVLALAAAVLDLATRFRVRNLFGLLPLAGVYSLGAALALNPAVLLADFPLTLLSRVLGASTLAALVALLVWQSLLEGRRDPLVPVLCAAAGGVAALFARLFPPLVSPGAGETPPDRFLAAAFAGMALGAALYLLAARKARRVTPDHLLLGAPGWAGVVLAVGTLTLWRRSPGSVDDVALGAALALTGFLLALLAFSRARRMTSLVEVALPPAPPRRWFIALPLAFLAGALAGYVLPPGAGESDPMALFGAVFIAFAVVWVPAVSLVLGGRALMREVRAQRL